MGAYQQYQIQSYPNFETNVSESATDVSTDREIASLTGLEHTADGVKSITFDNGAAGANDIYVKFAKTSAPTATTSDRRVPAGERLVVNNVRHNFYAIICSAGLTSTVNVTIEAEGSTG